MDCAMQKAALAAYSIPIILFSGFARDCRTQYTTIHTIAKANSFFSYNFSFHFLLYC